MAYRKIPRRLITDRGAPISRALAHLADIELAKVENELRLSQAQFSEVQQLRRTRNFGNATIECFAGFGEAWAKVTFPGGAGGEKVKKPRRECFCLPCFAMGFVTAVYYDDPCSSYTVEICQKTTETPDQIGEYVEVGNVLALDYAIYEVGQPVLVSIVPCSSGPSCGCSTGVSMCEITTVFPLPCSLMIVPLHLNGPDGYLRIPKWKTVEDRWGALY